MGVTFVNAEVGWGMEGDFEEVAEVFGELGDVVAEGFVAED